MLTNCEHGCSHDQPTAILRRLKVQFWQAKIRPRLRKSPGCDQLELGYTAVATIRHNNAVLHKSAVIYSSHLLLYIIQCLLAFN